MSQPIEITTARESVDVDFVHGYLSEESYWAKGIPREIVVRSIQHSMPFSLFEDGRQIGFARVVTDQATFGYLADVFIAESHRGRGLSRMLMEAILRHPALQGLRRWHLVTRDAQPLYAQFGFVPLDVPERHMMMVNREVYEPVPIEG